MHDKVHEADNNNYFPAEIFTGFAAEKALFVMQAVQAGKQANIVILSHINLLVAGWLIKKMNPSAKIMLLAHGIEIWGELSKHKKNMLTCCDKILSVSHFTSEAIAAKHGISKSKLIVLNNCIDPFLNNEVNTFAIKNIRNKYLFAEDDIVLLTLTRLSAKDRYKGYDVIIAAMVNLVAENKKIKYLLAGGCSKDEQQFIQQLIKDNNLINHVVLAGYVEEDDLAAYFSMADVYVMPSTKEGFGIVFIEAMYYGIPVIAGNTDGSTDALLNGKLGLLIPPNDPKEMELAIKKIIENKSAFQPNHHLLMENFGYDAYKIKLEKILSN